jgi:hypothetical protein
MMVIKDWGIKFSLGEVVTLRPKGVSVRVERVDASRESVIYDVREVDSGIGYPADQKDLAKIYKQGG